MTTLQSFILHFLTIVSIGVIHGAHNGNTIPCGSLMCQQISNTYIKEHLPHGYVQITRIPSGSSNISIKVLNNSANSLVLKTVDDHYIINGINGLSSSGLYKHEGSSFEYVRLDDNNSEGDDISERIFSPGPILKPLDLLLLVKEKNAGVTYEYLVPVDANNSPEVIDYNYDESDWNELDTPQDFIKQHRKEEEEEGEIQEVSYSKYRMRPRLRYMWKIIGFGACSKSCGGGIQNPIFRCIRDSPTRFYPVQRCVHLDKPIFNENIYHCSMQSCPGQWHAEKWSECTCATGEGVQERSVRCIQEFASGAIVHVSNSICSEPRPDQRRKCECLWLGKKRNSRLETLVRPNSYMRVSHSTNLTNRRTLLNEKLGTWLTSEWNNHCSTECGSGYEYRSIFCDRTPPHSERCDPRTTPDTVRLCESEHQCVIGEWLTASWGRCEGNCFNLQKKRKVFCLKNNLVAEDHECNVNQRPVSVTNCSLDDVKYCRPQWHYSAWSSCSKTCGGGTQRRSVRCLELDLKENIQRDSKNCLYVDRQPVYSTCNTQKCPDMLMDPRINLVPNDSPSLCDDIFPNCQIVVKAKLCSLEYYQRNCCFTCTGR